MSKTQPKIAVAFGHDLGIGRKPNDTTVHDGHQRVKLHAVKGRDKPSLDASHAARPSGVFNPQVVALPSSSNNRCSGEATCLPVTASHLYIGPLPRRVPVSKALGTPAEAPCSASAVASAPTDTPRPRRDR